MNIGDIINSAGLKSTPQRRMIYEVMTELGHSPIDEIVAKVQEQSKEITLSTVYRILDSFSEVGLLSKFQHPNGKTIFDITSTNHHHIFTDEGNVIDFEDEELTELIRQKLIRKISDKEKIGKISIQVLTIKNEQL